MKVQPISDLHRLQVIEIPVKMVAIVFNAVTETMGLGDIDIAFVIKSQSSWRSDFLLFKGCLDGEHAALRNHDPGNHRSGDQSLDIGFAVFG